MVCHLSAPSHYLNQCWHIVNWSLGNKLQWNSNQNSNIFIHENTFENVIWALVAILSQFRGRWVKVGSQEAICYAGDRPHQYGHHDTVTTRWGNDNDRMLINTIRLSYYMRYNKWLFGIVKAVSILCIDRNIIFFMIFFMKYQYILQSQ